MKRGKFFSEKVGSHVGMILSFVVFIIFLVFLYSIIQPAVKTEQDKEIMLEHMKTDVMQEVSSNLTTMTFTTEKSSDENGFDCIKIPVPDSAGNSPYAIVKNKDGEIVSSGISSGNIKIKWNGASEEFFKIYFSDQLFLHNVLLNSNCVDDETYYKIGSVRTTQEIFQTKIISAIFEYANDHEKVRERLGIPADSDFAIGAVLDDGSVFGKELTQTSVNVYSERYSVQYVNANADIRTAEFQISVW